MVKFGHDRFNGFKKKVAGLLSFARKFSLVSITELCFLH